MTELDPRAILRAIATEVRPADLYDRALRRSRILRRRRAMAAALAAAVAVVAISGATWQLANRSPHTPLPAAPSNTASSVAADPVTSMIDATLTLPDWSVSPLVGVPDGYCPSGSIPFDDGAHVAASGAHVLFQQAVVNTVPSDQHYIVAFVCMDHEMATSVAAQVLAYRAVGDSFALVDRLVDPGLGAEANLWLTGVHLAGAVGGEVTVGVVVDMAGPPEAGYRLFSQSRTYAWSGDRYYQAGGPTSFVADVDLSMTVSELTFGPAVEFCRSGTISLTIANHGPSAVDDVAVALILPGLGQGDKAVRECQADPEAHAQALDSALVTVGTVAAGQTRTVTATIFVDTRTDPRFAQGFADLRVGAAGQVQRTGTVVPVAVRY